MHPHSGRLFVGFLAGAFFFVECHFGPKTRVFMIFHQNEPKMIPKGRIIARIGILDPPSANGALLCSGGAAGVALPGEGVGGVNLRVTSF